MSVFFYAIKKLQLDTNCFLYVIIKNIQQNSCKFETKYFLYYIITKMRGGGNEMNSEIKRLFKIEQEKIIISEKIKELNKQIYEMSKSNPISEKYEDLLAELSLAYQEEMFVRGFKLGMRLTKEV